MNRFFILGNPRSGTSLLRLILHAHPQVVAPPESGFLHWWAQRYQTWQGVSLEAFVDDILSSKKIADWGLSREALLQVLRAAAPATYADAVEQVYLAYAQKLGKQQVEAVVDKNNYYIRHIPDLISIWPDARFIHIIRDGRDVACSYRGIQQLKSSSPYLPQLPSSIAEIATEWRANNLRILNQVEAANRPMHTLRYEDLVQKPAEVLHQLTAFMGMQVADEMFAFNQTNDEPASTLDWKQLTRGPITSSQIGRYVQLLSQEEVSTFEQVAGELIVRFGYATS